MPQPQGVPAWVWEVGLAIGGTIFSVFLIVIGWFTKRYARNRDDEIEGLKEELSDVKEKQQKQRIERRSEHLAVEEKLDTLLEEVES